MPAETPRDAAGTGPARTDALTFDKRRWYVRINHTDDSGVTRTWVASADSGLTGGDGIWFGTEAEYEEAENDL